MKEKPTKKGTIKNLKSRYLWPMDNWTKSYRHKDAFGLAILILLGIIIYSNSFKCSFHFDDLTNITGNYRIHNLSDVKAWWSFSPARIVSIFTFVLNYHFSQLNVWSYHLVNLMIHLINACLVWWITLLIFNSPAIKDSPASKNKKIIAFFTALLFVSHPLATQSVTYIVQRQTSMAAMFYLLSLALYAKARMTDSSQKNKYLFFTGCVISAFLAFFSKENAYTLPGAIVLFELFFLRAKKRHINFKDWRVILLILAFLSIIIVLSLKFSANIFRPIHPLQSLGSSEIITSTNYLLTQFSVIVKYIQLLILPINQNLDYDFPVSNSFFELRTLSSFLLLISLLVLAIFLFKKHRIVSFGIFWFFLTLSVESGIIPINDVIYEHRTYLPSFGFFLILTTVIFVLLWKKNKYLAIALFVIIALINSVLTFQRNKIWKDELTLWTDVVSKSPGKARPYGNRGVIYDDLGQSDKALADFSKAIQIEPCYAMAYTNRGLIYGSRGQFDNAIRDFSRALELEPNNSFAVWNRGITYSNLQQWEKAIADYSRIIEINQYEYDPFYNRGVAYGNLQQYDSAMNNYTKAIAYNRRHARAYYNRGILYYYMGQWQNAFDDFSNALEINPDFKEAYYNRNAAYLKMNSAMLPGNNDTRKMD
ncbi:MAG TPA: tetratricopeptide repeat protein [Bacteroidales bacterium]|nr:tetratricopeptide repeat protein [Bacteroidales bacterium]